VSVILRSSSPTWSRCFHQSATVSRSLNRPEFDGDTFALVREDEGIIAIRATPSGEWARISLGVHSSLEAVGLTAAFSRALAAADISANVVAGLHHDHIFVQWERREQALRVLQAFA
jgi:hypothetical protein